MTNWLSDKIATNGIQMHYTRTGGNKPPIVLAHGFSAQLGLAPSQDTGRVEAHLRRSGLPTRLGDIPGELPGTDHLMDAIAQDKKVARGALTFILTRGIGQSFIEKDVDPAAVRAYLEQMR